MASRLAHREAAPFARRALAAFALGAAIAAGGLGVLAAAGASARGAFVMAFAGDAPAARAGFTLLPLGPDPASTPHRRKRRNAHIVVVSAKAADAVCVRLCDGYFFPLPASTSDAAAACDSQCPDAPTEVFYRKDPDRIEDAVSANGRPYTALPVALRYRSHSDPTCSCHRGAVARTRLDDPTLRRGDIVMTPAGFVMYQGAGASGAGDFTALAKAPLPQARRVALQAMERASLDRDHPTLGAWLASQSAPVVARAEAPVERASGGDRIRLVVWRGQD